MNVTIDTSGIVIAPEGRRFGQMNCLHWSELDPFTQGYVEALLESGERHCERCAGNGEIITDHERYLHAHDGDVGDEAVAECPDCGGQGSHTLGGFRDLAPETLMRIRKDCAAFQATDAWKGMLVAGFMSPTAMPRDAGVAFWNTRNLGGASNFWDDYWTDYGGGTELAEAVAAFPPLTPILSDDGKVVFQ